MIDLSKVEGEAGRMYSQEYIRVISAMLPTQLFFKLDLVNRTQREKFEEIHSTYKQLEAESQHWLCHTQKKEASEIPYDTRNDQRTRLEGQREASRN